MRVARRRAFEYIPRGMRLRLARLGAPVLLLGVVSCTGANTEEDGTDERAGAGSPPPAAQPSPADLPDRNFHLPAPFDGKPLSTATADNGLVIADHAVGEGPEVVAGMDVAVHYSGFLEDGQMFDSSLERRRPFQFTVGQGRVIDAWDQGILGMKVGGKRVLEVPPELGYGAKKAGKIPPNSHLIFTMELLAAHPPLPAPKGDDAFAGKPLSKTELEGGLVVEELAAGEGEPAKKGDTVLVHYTGKLDDGTVFDSSVPRKQPIAFPLGVGKVVKGWDLGLDGMKVGGLRRLTIPPELGYKDKAVGKIPANSTLTFTVELMAIR
jgi:FKBP-type peptidyl-prolyl cis-trans isomerase